MPLVSYQTPLGNFPSGVWVWDYPWHLFISDYSNGGYIYRMATMTMRIPETSVRLCQYRRRQAATETGARHNDLYYSNYTLWHLLRECFSCPYMYWIMYKTMCMSASAYQLSSCPCYCIAAKVQIQIFKKQVRSKVHQWLQQPLACTNCFNSWCIRTINIRSEMKS